MLPDPHASETRHAHECKQNGAWACTSQCENASDQHSVDIGLTQGG